MKRLETDVVIIGGGATGAGVFRDCCLRGMRTILVERNDIATGTTGRNHGLLHSGARYAVTDGHSATECIRENRTLKHIASHCIENTDGLFISLPEDGLEYQAKFINGCARAGIPTEILTPEQALRLEPVVNPSLIGAVRIPDGTIDPFRITSSNILDGREHGGTLLTDTRAVGLIIQQGQVAGIHCLDVRTGERYEIRAAQVINATGAWCHEIMEYADLSVDMYHSRGALLIMGHRMNGMVINRCRKPGDSDILVPGDTVSVIGTTSTHVGRNELENMEVTDEEVRVLLEEGCKLAPSMASTRILRAYCGVRPLVSTSSNGSDRTISRGLVAIDHADSDNLPGLITITGGKLMTYRLMAEVATDMAAKHLGISKACTTASVPLPGAQGDDRANSQSWSLPNTVSGSAVYRHGDRARNFIKEEDKNKQTDLDKQESSPRWRNAVVCECEVVTRGEILYAVDKLNARSLSDLRRRTRIGMGPCQGEMCACRTASLLAATRSDVVSPLKALHEFVDERWKGVRPVLWGDGLREAEFSYWVQEGLLGLGSLKSDQQNDQQNDSEALIANAVDACAADETLSGQQAEQRAEQGEVV